MHMHAHIYYISIVGACTFVPDDGRIPKVVRILCNALASYTGETGVIHKHTGFHGVVH